MDLKRTFSVLWRRKGVVLLGALVGIVLAFFSLYSVKMLRPIDGGRTQVKLVRKSYTTYQTKVSVLIDTPGFGAGRADVPMDKPSIMSPTFAVMATGDDVMREVRKRLGGPVKATVTAAPIERSPVLEIGVEGTDALYVRKVATTVASSLIDYVGKQQADNDVPAASRLKLSIIGSPPAETTMSRDYEIAGMLFFLPLVLAIGLAFALENVADHSGPQPAVATVSDAEVPAPPSAEHPYGTMPSGDRPYAAAPAQGSSSTWAG